MQGYIQARLTASPAQICVTIPFSLTYALWTTNRPQWITNIYAAWCVGLLHFHFHQILAEQQHPWHYHSTSWASRQTTPLQMEVRLMVGVCVAWCQNSTVVNKHCSPLIDFINVTCRPFCQGSSHWFSLLLFTSLQLLTTAWEVSAG